MEKFDFKKFVKNNVVSIMIFLLMLFFTFYATYKINQLENMCTSFIERAEKVAEKSKESAKELKKSSKKYFELLKEEAKENPRIADFLKKIERR